MSRANLPRLFVVMAGLGLAIAGCAASGTSPSAAGNGGGASEVGVTLGNTKPGWWEPGFVRECVVAGDGFEPPTFGL